MKMTLNTVNKLVMNDDGTYTISFFGREIGWISRVRAKMDNSIVYRALTWDGDIRHFPTLRIAQQFICERHH